MRCPLIPSLRTLLVAGAAIALAGLSVGCGDDSAKPEARSAEQAVGIDPKGSTNSTKVTRDVDVVTETTVRDKKSGRILSDKVESAPVTITEETDVKKGVKVDVGETKSTKK